MKGCDFLDKQTLAELSAEIQEGTESARAALESMRHALEPSGGDGRAEAQLSAGDLTKLVRELMAAHRAVCEVNQTLARLLAAQQGATHVVPTARSVEQRETRATRRARAGVATAGEAEPTRAGGVERLRGELRELRMELDRMPATPQRADWEQRWAALNRQLEQEPVDEETLRREIQLLRSVVFSTLWAERLPVGSAVLKSPRELRTLPSRPRTVKVASRRIPRRLAMAMAVAGVLTLGGVAVALRLVQPHGVSEAAISREDAGVSDSGRETVASAPAEESQTTAAAVVQAERETFVDEGMMFRCVVPAGWRATTVRSGEDESLTKLESGRGEEIWVAAHGREWPPMVAGGDEEREMRRITRVVNEVTGSRWTYYVHDNGWDVRRPNVPFFWMTARATKGDEQRHVEGMHFREGGRDFVLVWIGPADETAALAASVLHPFLLGIQPVPAMAANGGETPFLRGIVAEAFGRSMRE